MDYTIPNPKGGQIAFAAAPLEGDSLAVDFNYTWFDDAEWDVFLSSASKKCGLPIYYVGAATIPTAIPLPAGATAPSDIPDGLFDAITNLAASAAAEALA